MRDGMGAGETVRSRVVTGWLLVRDDGGMRGPGRVGRAWIGAVSLAVVLAGIGFWVAALGAGIGAVAGGFAPLLIERATRREESAAAAREVETGRRRYGPAHLLEPGLGVVPFSGRAAELAALEGWCLDGGAGLVRLVTGGGGAGKTRLALELMGRMRVRGWVCAQVAEGAEPDVARRERARAPGAPLLLVVDYAEARRGLGGLLEAAARDEGQVRVLLAARHAGDWWDRLQGGGGVVRDLMRDAGLAVVELGGDVEPGLPAVQEVRRAVPFFGARLGVAAPEAGLVSVAVPDRSDLRVLDCMPQRWSRSLPRPGGPRGSRSGWMPGWCWRSCWGMRNTTGGAARRRRGCWTDRPG